MPRLLALATALTALLSFVGARALIGGADTQSTPPALISSGASAITSLEDQAAQRPDDADVQVALTVAYLQRERETGDPTYYGLADRAASRALALRPDDPNALVAAGVIAASRHDFTTALNYAGRAHAAEPALLSAYAVRVDSLVELGRYDEALSAAQEMADRRPDYAALTRISYLRELHGDLDGAIRAMRDAADRGTGIRQDRVWALVQLGILQLTNGDPDAAEQSFREAQDLLPQDPIVSYGRARIEIARGDLAAAELHLRDAVARLPQPEYLILLGDVLDAQGKSAEAAKQYATVHAIERIYAANGVDTGLDLAVFQAEHGDDPAAAYERALTAHEGRPSVTAAEIVAWTAYKAGRLDAAQDYIARALALGTKSGRLSYHAGIIARASGDEASAKRHFEDARDMRAELSPVYRADLDSIVGGG